MRGLLKPWGALELITIQFCDLLNPGVKEKVQVAVEAVGAIARMRQQDFGGRSERQQMRRTKTKTGAGSFTLFVALNATELV
jgi:hypothetical protein